MYQDTTERTIVQHNKNQLTRTGKMSEWISVKDQLPEDGTNALVVIDGILIAVGRRLTASSYPDGWEVVVGDPLSDLWGSAVTHWMPLPEPPSE